MELEEGTLPLETFRCYVVQDFHYLAGFGRAVATALSKATDDELAKRLLPRVATPIERPLHRHLFDLLEIDYDAAAATEVSPTNKAYTDHLEVTAADGGVGPAAAALLPCPWTYHRLGSILRRPNHPIYDAWFDGYASGLLAKSTAAWRELVDDFGDRQGSAGREAMRRAFLVSARYEYMFWTMAYSRERWPVAIGTPTSAG
jgi:thiaminase/transcriptional activator TenA